MTRTPLRVFVAHSEWALDRRAGLRRMLEALKGCDVVVLGSKVKEHSSVWSDRLWQACSEFNGDSVCLNDDVFLPPRFGDAVSAMLVHAESDIVALHTSLRSAPSLAHAGQRFLQTYFVTGPGYVLRRGVARHLLRFARGLNPKHRAGTQEDNVAISFCWSRREPCWSTIPGLVLHDTSVASTCGYDDHPDRRSSVPWNATALFGASPGLVDPDFWVQPNAPAFIECPWMPTESLASTEIMTCLGIEPGYCWACKVNQGEIGAPKTGLMLCPPCGLSLGYSAGQVLLDWRTRVKAKLNEKLKEEKARAATGKVGPAVGALVAAVPPPIPADILTRRT